MARRRSRISRVSRKSSRRGRKTMKRSKVSRKRSRVSRKRSSVSRTNRTRKRSRVLRNKRGGTLTKFMRRSKVGQSGRVQLDPLDKRPQLEETQAMLPDARAEMYRKLDAAERSLARERELARQGATKAPDRIDTEDAKAVLNDLKTAMRTEGALREQKVNKVLSDNRPIAEALFAKFDDVGDWAKKLFKTMKVTRAEVEEAVKKTAELLQDLSVNQVKALKDRRVNKRAAINELERLATSQSPTDFKVKLKLFELAVRGVGFSNEWPPGYAGYHKYKEDIISILPPKDSDDPAWASFNQIAPHLL